MLRLHLRISVILAVVFSTLPALAQQAQAGEKLIAPQSVALPWIVGVGILVGTVIAGFKCPGRTHLD